jgi:hypothetical protein
MNSNDAVFELAAIAVVLPCRRRRTPAALMNSRFVNQANGIRMSVIAGDDLLASISQSLLIPLDGFQKTL